MKKYSSFDDHIQALGRKFDRADAKWNREHPDRKRLTSDEFLTRLEAAHLVNRAEGLAFVIIVLLVERDVLLPPAVRARILTCHDERLLRVWLRRAATAVPADIAFPETSFDEVAETPAGREVAAAVAGRTPASRRRSRAQAGKPNGC